MGNMSIINDSGLHIINYQDETVTDIEKAVSKIKEIVMRNKNGYVEYAKYAIMINNNLFIAYIVKGGYLHFVVNGKYCSIGKDGNIKINDYIPKSRFIKLLDEAKEDYEKLIQFGIIDGLKISDN